MDNGLVHSDLSRAVLACAFEVHARLGPGLLENIYATCLGRELRFRGLEFKAEVPIAVEYRGATLESAYRADFLVEDRLLLELKAVERLLPVHEPQALTYLRLSGLRVALLLNFNVVSLKHGVRRFVR